MTEHYPPAQHVGHEFVRHYYTLLHEDPLQLHRFYLENSSFVHAGGNSDDEPVVGQTNIYDKIASLNFVECRARIKQVDSQPTLADGVVVQVTGEISNNRQPMRPFVQTFVLSPEGPKKYYVRNDIFRYQDEIYEVESQSSDVGPPVTAHEGDEDEFLVSGGESQTYDATSVQNGQEEEVVMEEAAPLDEQAETEVKTATQTLTETEPTGAVANENKSMPGDPSEAGAKHSWANIAAASKASSQPSQPALRASPKITAVAATPSPQQPPRQPSPQPQRERPPRRQLVSDPANPTAIQPERPIQPRPQKPVYSDSQQIFVGNIPQAVEETEFRELFQRFGTVLDVRLNPRHFGFVTFEDPDTVRHLLGDQAEVKLRGQRLNIEEKKSNLPRGRGKDNPGMSGTPGRSGRMDRDRDRYSGRGQGKPPHDGQKY
jgi:Ras GTPase-activating protein-binding protein 1